MKLMFASDIHGSLPATERVLELFEQNGADWLILLGDLLNHGPRNALPAGYQPAQVAERLNRYSDKIIAVRGNCDSEVDQMLLTFPIEAPWQQVLLQKTIVLTHGHLYHPRHCRRYPAVTSWPTAIRICRRRSGRVRSIASIRARSAFPKGLSGQLRHVGSGHFARADARRRQGRRGSGVNTLNALIYTHTIKIFEKHSLINQRAGCIAPK